MTLVLDGRPVKNVISVDKKCEVYVESARVFMVLADLFIHPLLRADLSTYYINFVTLMCTEICSRL